MTKLERLGWNEFFQEQIVGDAPPPQVARVIEEQRGAYRVAGDFDGWAEVSGKFRHEARTTAEFPAVGDWVCVTAPAGLPRRSDERDEREGGIGRAVITRRLDRR